MSDIKRKRLIKQGKFGKMNSIQQILHRWCPEEGGKKRLALLCEVRPQTVDTWFKGTNIPYKAALDGISIVCEYPRKRLGELHETLFRKDGVVTPQAFTLKYIKECVVNLTEKEFYEVFEHYCDSKKDDQ